MSLNQKPAIVRWLPAILLGIVIGEIGYLLLVWQGVCDWSWYNAVVLVVVGALLGYDISRHAFGVYNSLRTGHWIRVLLWTVFGGIAASIMALLIRYNTPQQFATFLPDRPLARWSVFIIVGMLFGLMGIGGDFRKIEPPKPQANNVP